MLRIGTLGCRWDCDLSRLEPDVARRLVELWAPHVRPGGPDPLADIAADSERADGPDRSEPEGFPRPLICCHPGQQPMPAGAVELSRDAQTAPYEFSSAITMLSITAQSGRLTLLHSAALALPTTGATVLLIGESGTGKSTAARILGRELGYLSDETAAIRDDLTMLAHPKPISILPSPGAAKTELSPAELGLLPAPDEAWAAATVLLVRDPACATARLEPVPLLEAMALVIPQTSALPTQRDPLDTLARCLSAGAGVHRLRYAEIADAVPLIRDLLTGVRRGSSSGARWSIIVPAPGRRTAPWVATPDVSGVLVTPETRVLRAPYRDAIDDGEELLIINGPKPSRLLGLGATLWQAAVQPVSVADATRTVIARHGDHPDAARLVAHAATTLVEHGLLEIVAPA